MGFKKKDGADLKPTDWTATDEGEVEDEVPPTQFTVEFELSSVYKDESFNMTETIWKTIEAGTVDDVLRILNDTDYISKIDEDDVLNEDTEDSPVEVKKEYKEIQDELMDIVWEKDN